MSSNPNHNNDGLTQEERMLREIAESLVNEALDTSSNTERSIASGGDSSRHSVLEIQPIDEPEQEV